MSKRPLAEAPSDHSRAAGGLRALEPRKPPGERRLPYRPLSNSKRCLSSWPPASRRLSKRYANAGGPAACVRPSRLRFSSRVGLRELGVEDVMRRGVGEEQAIAYRVLVRDRVRVSPVGVGC